MKSKPKSNQVSQIRFVTKYNPMLLNKDGIIKKHISILHSDDKLKTLFPKDCFTLIAPSIYHKK